MTENPQLPVAVFYVWWVFINDLIYFAEFWFLQSVAGIRKRRGIVGYVLASGILTFSVMYFQSPGVYRVILHMGVILIFSVFLLKLDWADAVGPIAVVFAMVTLMEGFQTLLMGWFVRQTMSPGTGIAVQMIVEGILTALLAASLFFIAKRYSYTVRSKLPSYLYDWLSDQIREQKGYLEEVKKRNEQYRAFQHDVDNHLLVLSGLIREKKYAEAKSYSGKLCDISGELTVNIDTGNPAADILLKEKIGFAETNGIRVEYDVHFSRRFYIEDTDLCILLANAMDNAIKACAEESQDKPLILVTAGMKRHFLLIKVVNTVALGTGGVKCGTGLNNIRRTVKKYEGTVDIKLEEEQFCISMLLCLRPFADEE